MALVLCVPLLAGSAWLTRNDDLVGKGQRAYASKRYEKAAAHFSDAMEGDGNRDALQFNLGTALAEQGRAAAEPEEASRLLRLAVVALQRALDASEPTLRRNAHYNLANALVWNQDYEPAIGHYRIVLREDPGDLDARHNLELAQRLRDADVFLEDADPKEGQGGAGAERRQASASEDGTQEAGTPSEGVGAGADNSTPGNGDGTEGRDSSGDGLEPSKAPVMRAEPRPMREPERTEARGVEEKLNALERRSSELRRGRVLRRTKAMRRARHKGAE